MQKPLPRQTLRSLSPPAGVIEPYSFFEHVRQHPLEPLDTALNLRNAWWLADASLLAYSTEAAIKAAFRDAGIGGETVFFHAGRSTDAYVMAMPDAIVLAFRGTQVDDFWSTVLDLAVDAQFLPVADSHGDLVHAGFLGALSEIWMQLASYLKAEQQKKSRPLWVTGHSLGAGLATLAANLCSDDPAFGLRGVYTFGSPRVGAPEFGARIAAPVFRFRHDSDIVPHAPIGLVFRHVGRLQFIDGAGHLHRDLGPGQKLLLDAGTPLLSTNEGMTLKTAMRVEGTLELVLPGFLADHAPINYSVLAWNCYRARM